MFNLCNCDWQSCPSTRGLLKSFLSIGSQSSMEAKCKMVICARCSPCMKHFQPFSFSHGTGNTFSLICMCLVNVGKVWVGVFYLLYTPCEVVVIEEK